MAELDLRDPGFVAAYDDLPLWSAAPGLLLLDEVRLTPTTRALDVGPGTGFPLVELAERIGARGEVHGVDPWEAALARARDKIERRGVENAFVHVGSAEALPFRDACFDLIVSNLGLNNLERPRAVLAECRRVARRGAQLALSTNLQGTFAELYPLLASALAEVGVADAAARVAEHVAKRATVNGTRELLRAAGFAPDSAVERLLRLRWATAGALLAHSFVRLAFRPAWEELAPAELRADAMAALARRLEARAADGSGIELTVPFACILAEAA